MASIDFNGTDGVLTAYRMRSIPTWAVFNKGNFMQSGDDEQSLSDYLELMEGQGSRTVYTLKVYREENADQVTDKSACNGSFSFSLYETASRSMLGMGGGNNISARLAAIEKKLTGDPENEKKSVIGKLTDTFIGWLEDPDDVVKIIGAVKMLLGKSSPAEMLQTVSALGAVAPKKMGIVEETMQPETVTLTPEQEQTIQRFAIVISRLEKCDPEILLHLEQLANLAETNPAMYKMALGFLK